MVGAGGLAGGDALTVLGLMSGTSADGIDGTVARLSARPTLEEAQRTIHHHVPFSSAQREVIFALFNTAATTADQLSEANFLLGEWFAEAAHATMQAAGLAREDVDLIGSHGQTIFHAPPGSPGVKAPNTLQIGEPCVIAERTGVTTVADFRVRDVAAGGQGAPLVSYVDALLFRSDTTKRVVLNLGGIANVTVLFPQGDPRPPLAFDTGPANMVLDWLADRLSGSAFDHEGRLAAAGTPDEVLLADLMEDPYFKAPPPKTTGRERYGASYAADLLDRAREQDLSVPDTMATALALTARTVATAIRAAVGLAGDSSPITRHTSLEVIAGGGGTRNRALMQALAALLPDARVMTHEDVGISSQAKESLSFAILAAQAIRGLPNTVPSATGARQAVVMGKIVPGANYTALMRRLFSEVPVGEVRR